MKFSLSVVALGSLVASGAAYKATTTRYYDGQEGACGCGSSSGPFSWSLGISTDVYTAAGSQALFDTDDATWCGAGCGKCYNVTSTGESPCTDCGTGGVAGESIILMVTNLCPYDGNEEWCPEVGGTNEYGYSYHFDIMAESEVFGDNVVVDFELVACPGQAAADWGTCICYGETESDATPAGMSTVAADDDSASQTSTSSSSSSSSTSSSSSSTTTTTSAAPTTTTTSSSLTVATTSAITTATLTTTTKATTTTSGCQAQQSLYGQCGGIGWTGATACVTGATCTVQNDYYYQCVAA